MKWHERVKELIQEIARDDSVSTEEWIEGLEEIADECASALGAAYEDRARAREPGEDDG